jgi:hypothetical protein
MSRDAISLKERGAICGATISKQRRRCTRRTGGGYRKKQEKENSLVPSYENTLLPVTRHLPHMDVPMPRRQDAENGRHPSPAAHGCANAAKAGRRERPSPKNLTQRSQSAQRYSALRPGGGDISPPCVCTRLAMIDAGQHAALSSAKVEIDCGRITA